MIWPIRTYPTASQKPHKHADIYNKNIHERSASAPSGPFASKSELQDAIWDEVDFENAVWTIPKEQMKRSKAHNVYLSRQTHGIMIALKTCAGNSRYLLPLR